MFQLTAKNIQLHASAKNKEDATRQAGPVLIDAGNIAPGYVASMLGREGRDEDEKQTVVKDTPGNPDIEWQKLRDARESAKVQLQDMYDSMKARVGKNEGLTVFVAGGYYPQDEFSIPDRCRALPDKPSNR